MASAFDASVTLEDVFVVVSAKRVPLAPELAGYLLLEIVDGADGSGGEIDPRSVFIGEEGSVALVRRRRDPATALDAEASARGILRRLLEASGSQTPALAATVRRKSGGGLRALAIEVESALIPVNRAAGRRALARLAREVRRVTMGVGRNATVPASTRTGEPPQVAPSRQEPAEPSIEARPRQPEVEPEPEPFEDDPRTLARGAADAVVPAADAQAPRSHPTPNPLPDPTRPPQRAAASRAQPMKPRALTPMPPPAGFSAADEPTLARKAESLFGRDEVDSLLATFEVSQVGDEKGVSRELKAMADLEPTPAPPSPRQVASLVEAVPPKQSAASPDLPAGTGPGRQASTRDKSEAQAAAKRAPGDGALDDGGVEELLQMVSARPPAVQPAEPRSPPVARDPTPLVSLPSGPPEIAPEPSAPTPSLRESPGLPPVAPARPHLPAVAPAVPGGHAEEDRVFRKAPGRAERSGLPGFAPEPRFERPRAPKTGFAMTLLALAVLATGVAAVYKLRPDFFSGRGRVTPTPSAPVGPEAPRCKATLIASDVPPGAEVLLRVGQAPTDVERLPVGIRLEFVGTAEGYAPRRAIVPPNAPWDKGPDGKPRFELAMQLDPSKKPGVVDSWPPGEAGANVGGEGSPGTVRIVTTPRGSEVWLLVGMGPEARIERLKCDADVDVLVAGPTTLRKRLRASVAQIAAAPLDESQTHVIKLSAR